MTLLEAINKNNIKTILSSEYAKDNDINHIKIVNYIKLLIMHNDINSKYFICQKFGPIDDLRDRFIIHPKGIQHLNKHFNMNSYKIFNSSDIF